MRLRRGAALLCAVLLLLCGCRKKPAASSSLPDLPLAPPASSMPVWEFPVSSAPQQAEAPAASSSAPQQAETPAASSAAPQQTPPSSSAAPQAEAAPDEHGTYTSKEDVARYLIAYGHLPENFITKAEARALGWDGGALEPYAPGCCIGGDRFGNREGRLPKKKGRTYYECDIGTLGKRSRGAKRIIYSDDGLLYYTGDHYETFTLLYGEE